MAADEEIEQYLLQKLDYAIEKQKSNEQNPVSKLVSFETEFLQLKNMLTKRTHPAYEDQEWLSLRRENLYYLDNLLTEWQRITKKKYSFSDYQSYESIKKSLKKMKKEIIGKESSTYSSDRETSASHHQETNQVSIEVYRWSSRHGPRNVHGLEYKVMAMERELVVRNNGAPFKAFGVVGDAGIGKTTLCQTVFGRKKVMEYFSPRIWVCLSKQPKEDADNRKEIVIRILKCLGIEDEVISDAGNGSDSLRRLVFLLRLQLIGKRYLIVIDDAWNVDKFFMNLTETDENCVDELSYGLPKGHGGTVILSSRLEALAKKMIGEDASLQYMKQLTDENCEEIFKDTVTGYDEDAKEFPQYLKDLKREILKTCDGLPLAAKLLGLIAREQLEKTATTVSAGTGAGARENKLDLAAGAGHIKRSGDAGGQRTGVQDKEHERGVK